MIMVLATFLAAILVGLGLFEKADPSFFRWLLGTGIAEILFAVLGPFREAFQPKGRVSVNLVFQDKSLGEIDLDVEGCIYELRDERTFETKAKGNLLPTKGPGGWQCVLPPSVSPSDYVKLLLSDKSGDRWEANWFLPLVITKEVVRI